MGAGPIAGLGGCAVPAARTGWVRGLLTAAVGVGDGESFHGGDCPPVEAAIVITSPWAWRPKK